MNLREPSGKQEFSTIPLKDQLIDLGFVFKINPTANSDLEYSRYDEPQQQFVTEKISIHQGKPMILHFWATWCGPCVKELPIYANFIKDNNISQIPVLVSFNEKQKPSVEDVQGFYKKFGVTDFPIIMDKDQQLAHKFEITSIPMTVFLDEKGIEIGRISGAIDWRHSEVKAIILKLLNGHSKTS